MPNEYRNPDAEARAYIFNKGNALKSGGKLPDPSKYLTSDEARSQAGYTPPQRYVAPEEKEEPGLLTKAWNALFGDSEEDIKAQQFNNAQYQKGLAEGKASASSPGTYWFGYDNPGDFAVDRVGKAIANGDLLEKNKQLYRRYYDKTSGQMKYETIPVAEFDKNGSVRPVSYRSSFTDAFIGVGLINPILQSANWVMGKVAGSDKYNENQFQTLARNTPDRNSLQGFGSGAINSFAEAFNPVDMVNNMLDGSRKTRSYAEQYRDVDGWDAQKTGDIVGQIGGSVAQMFVGGEIGAGIGLATAGLENLNKAEKVIKYSSMLGASLAPELKRFGTDVSENGDYGYALANLGAGVAANMIGMKVGGKFGEKVGDALARSAIEPVAEGVATPGINAVYKAVAPVAEETGKQYGKAIVNYGKGVLAQVGVDALQAAGETYLEQARDSNLEKQLYGKETGNTAEFLKKLGMRTAMSLLFNGVTEVFPIARSAAFDLVSKTDIYANKIDKLAVDAVAKKVADSGKVTEADISSMVNSMGSKEKFARELYENRLREHAGLTDPVATANRIITHFENGKTPDEVIKAMADEKLIVAPKDVAMARKTMPYMKEMVEKAPTGSTGQKAKWEAYSDLDESGKPIVSFRVKEPIQENVKLPDVPTIATKPTQTIKFESIDGRKAMSAESSGYMANYINDMTKMNDNPHIMKVINSIFPQNPELGIDYNPMGIAQIVKAYSNVTGESISGKPVAEIVDRLIEHLAGRTKAKYMDTNPGKYIDREVSSEISMAPADRLVAFGDRVQLYNMINKTYFDDTVGNLDRRNRIFEMFGIKVPRSEKVNPGIMFAEKTSQDGLTAKDIFDKLVGPIGTVEAVAPKAKGRKKKQVGPADQDIQFEDISNQVNTVNPTTVEPLVQTPAPVMNPIAETPVYQAANNPIPDNTYTDITPEVLSQNAMALPTPAEVQSDPNAIDYSKIVPTVQAQGEPAIPKEALDYYYDNLPKDVVPGPSDGTPGKYIESELPKETVAPQEVVKDETQVPIENKESQAVQPGISENPANGSDNAMRLGNNEPVPTTDVHAEAVTPVEGKPVDTVKAEEGINSTEPVKVEDANPKQDDTVDITSEQKPIDEAVQNVEPVKESKTTEDITSKTEDHEYVGDTAIVKPKEDVPIDEKSIDENVGDVGEIPADRATEDRLPDPVETVSLTERIEPVVKKRRNENQMAKAYPSDRDGKEIIRIGHNSADGNTSIMYYPIREAVELQVNGKTYEFEPTWDRLQWMFENIDDLSKYAIPNPKNPLAPIFVRPKEAPITPMDIVEEIPDKQLPKESKRVNYWSNKDKKDFTKEEIKAINGYFGSEKGKLTGEDMMGVSTALAELRVKGKKPAEAMNELTKISRINNLSADQEIALKKIDDVASQAAKSAGENADVESGDVKDIELPVKGAENVPDEVKNVKTMETPVAEKETVETPVATDEPTPVKVFDKLVSGHKVEGTKDTQGLGNKIKEILPETYQVAIASTKIGRSGKDKVEIMIRPKPGRKPMGEEDIAALRDRIATELGLSDAEKDFLKIGKSGQIALTGDRPKITIDKVDFAKADEMKTNIVDSFAKNPDPRVSIENDGLDNKKIVLKNMTIDEYESELINRGFTLQDIYTSYGTKNIDAYRTRGKTGNNWSILGIKPSEYMKQGLEANPLLIGIGMTVLGTAMDRDENNPSEIGKVLKIAGMGISIAYAGAKIGKLGKSLLASPIKDTKGEVKGIASIIDRMKSEPKVTMADSPMAKMQREVLLKKAAPNDRLRMEQNYKAFEKTEKDFVAGTFKKFRSLAHIEGDKAKELQAAAAKATILRDKFIKEITDSHSDFEKFCNDTDLEGQIIHANDEIFKKTTKVWNNQNLDREGIKQAYPGNSTMREKIMQYKKDVISGITSQESIRQTLAECGVEPENMAKALEGYSKFRDTQNKLTDHFTRTWLLGYNMEYDQLGKYLNDIHSAMIPLNDGIVESRNKLKELRAKFENVPDKKDIEKFTAYKENQKAIKAENAALQSYGSQIAQLKNRANFIRYASEFQSQSQFMHHLSNRWDLSMKDNPYGLAVYEVAQTKAGKYARVNDAVSKEQSMKYYRKIEDRIAAEKEMLSTRNITPVDESSKIYQVTNPDGTSHFIKIENEIDNNATNRFVSQNINVTKQMVLRLLKSDADVPQIRDRFAAQVKEIENTAGSMTGNESEAELDNALFLFKSAATALNSLDDRAKLISNIKDVFKYTLQPKARPMRRNKNVTGYEPKDNAGWVDLYRTGMDNSVNTSGNRYFSSPIRQEVENQLLQGVECGAKGEYVDYLNDFLDSVNKANTNVQSYFEKLLDPKSPILRSVRVAEQVGTTAALAWNVKAGARNLIEGNLGTAIGLLGEGMNPLKMVKASKGLPSALREVESSSPYKDEILNAIHNEILNSRVPYSTTIEHLNRGDMKVPDKLFKLQQWGETINRYTSAMSYGMALAQNSPRPDNVPLDVWAKDIAAKSANFTYKTQGNFDFLYRTDLEKGLLKNVPMGKTFLTLVSPAINQSMLYSNIMRKAFTMKEDKKQFVGAALAMVALVPLIGGIKAIPGASDLMSVLDWLDSSDPNNPYEDKKPTINKIQDDIEKMCASLGVPKNTIEPILNTYRKGIVSALTDTDVSGNASYTDMLSPFIVQKLYQAFSRDIPSIMDSDDKLSAFAKVLLSNVPAVGRLVSAGGQLAEGQRMDKNGNILGGKFGVGDFFKEGLLGRSLKDAIASEDIMNKNGSDTPQGIHKFMNELKSMKGIDLDADTKAEIAALPTMSDSKKLESGILVAYNNMNSAKAVENSRVQANTWLGKNKDLATRLVGGWMADQKPEYQGSNTDMNSFKNSMQSAISRYYRATNLAAVIGKATGETPAITYDNTEIPEELKSKYTTVGEAPYNDRGYLYVISKLLGKKEKYGYEED